MDIEENIKLGCLIDIYGDFLSVQQKNMILCYVNNDMTLSEIAENEHISRPAVLDAIKKAKQKLYEFENKLKLYEFKTRLQDAVKCEDSLCKSKVKKLLEEI